MGRQAATSYFGQINRIPIRTQRVMYIHTYTIWPVFWYLRLWAPKLV